MYIIQKYRVSLVFMIPTYDTTLSIDAVISRIGFGRFQWKLLWICGFGWAADGMEVLLISFVIPAVAKEWALSKSQIGWLGTAIFLGMMAGAWFWGRISDRVGRKFGFIGTVAIDSGFGLALRFCAILPLAADLACLHGIRGGWNSARGLQHLFGISPDEKSRTIPGLSGGFLGCRCLGCRRSGLVDRPAHRVALVTGCVSIAGHHHHLCPPLYPGITALPAGSGQEPGSAGSIAKGRCGKRGIACMMFPD